MNGGRVSKNELEQLVDTRLANMGPMIAEAVAQALGGQKQLPGRGTEPPLSRSGTVIRRRFEVKPEDKGVGAARFVRALAAAKGDPNRAAHFIKKAYDDDLGDEIHKALLASDAFEAGLLVPPQYSQEIIDLLRSRTVVRAAGARTVPMGNGNLAMRKQTASSSASYVGESQDIPVSQPALGQIEMVAKKLAAIIPISNDLLKYSSGPSADTFVRDDIVQEIALREDRAFIRDDGTQHTPKGLRFWCPESNIVPSNGTDAADIESDFRALFNVIEDIDVRLVNPVWLMHPSRKNFLRTLREGAGGAYIYPEIRSEPPMLFGWPVFTTTSIPRNLGVSGDESEIYLVDMSEALIGEASTLEIVVDSSASYVEGGNLISAFSRDETLIRAISRHDFAMRRPEAIAIMTEVAWI